MANKITDLLQKADDKRHGSSTLGDGLDSAWKATKALFSGTKNVATGTGGVAGKVVGGTVKGADTVVGTVATKTFDSVARHKELAAIALVAVMWKPVKNLFGHRKEKKANAALQAQAAQLSIAEANYAKRAAYAGQENNPGAQTGHSSRVSAGRGQGVGVN